VTKFDAAGASLLYSSLYGSQTIYGSPCTFACNQNTTESLAITVDSKGDAYITGWTQDGNLPVTAGAFQTTASPMEGNKQPTNYYLLLGWRNFVAKFDPTQSGTASLVYGTYLSGTGGSAGGADDYGTGITVDSADNAYITGSAGSPNFPVTKKAFQTTCDSGPDDVCVTQFITKLNPAGSGLVYSTMLGDQANGSGTAITPTRIRINSSGDAFVTGSAGSGFPLHNPISTSGTSYVTELNSTGSALLFSTYLDGGNVQPASLAVDSEGSVYVTGQTNALTVTPGAFQQTFGGYYDAFVIKVATIASDLEVTNSAPTSVDTGSNLTYVITGSNNGPDAATKVVISDTVPNGSTFVSVTTTSGTCTSPKVGGTGKVSCTASSLADSAMFTVTLTVNVDAAAGKTISDTAEISSADGYDPKSANNSAVAKTKVDK
jgi:uncharacterized repeat protein (TIGR01451 family)